MHACSSMIEHTLHPIHQPSISLLASAPTTARSAIARISILPNISSNLLPNNILTQIEIRLFHTLHSLIFYFNEHHNELLSLNTIELFVYLFMPYVNTYIRQNEREFLSNSDLYQGMKSIWQPLIEYHQPNIRIFNTFVKPKFFANEQRKTFEENFISQKELKTSTFIQSDSDPIARDSTSDTERLSLTNTNNNNNHHQPITMKMSAPLVDLHSICSASDLSRLTPTPQSPTDKIPPLNPLSTSISMNFFPRTRIPSSKVHSSEYLLLATYFDIAIIRTLFVSNWLTDGYIWCLEYLHKRLTDISDEILTELNLCAHAVESSSLSQLNSTKQCSKNLIEQQCLLTMSMKQTNHLLNPSSNDNSQIFYVQKIKRK